MSAMHNPRARIDRIDREIVALLARRQETVREISRLKQQDSNSTVRDDAREHEVSRAWAEAARANGLPGYFAARILREILGHSRRVQAGFVGRAEDETAGQTLTVAVPGAPQSYSDLALDTTQGFETLNRRIATAVNNVCMRSDPRELGSMRDVRLCREQALARANTDIQQLDGAEAFGLK